MAQVQRLPAPGTWQVRNVSRRGFPDSQAGLRAGELRLPKGQRGRLDGVSPEGRW